MKKLFLLLLPLVILNSCAKAQDESTPDSGEIVYTEQDVEIFSDIIQRFELQKDKPIGELIPEIGTYFLGNVYVDKTLEVTDSEKLIVNLRELDCTTYAENLLALARTLKSDSATFSQFTRELEKIRYRDGDLQEYPSRLHYFSDWIYNNKQKNLIETPADSFGETYPNDLNFMSTHPESYKHLKENPNYVEIIKQQEKEISSRDYFYIPKEEISDYEHLMQEGDIVGLTTNIDGLDISHVGVLVEQNGKMHLMHASQSKRKVEISEEPLASFLKPNSRNTGIMIARPVEVK